MTLDEILSAARSRAGDVDQAAYRYTKTELVVELADVRRTFAVRQVLGLSIITVTTTVGSEAIEPEPTDLQGTVLAAALALRVLQRTYRKRVDEGSLGISWRSGLEEESSISAEKAYRQMLDELAREVEELILIGNRGTFATRPQ